MFISWMLIMPSFKKSLIVEQFQGNYLKEQRAIRRRRNNQGQNYTRLFLKGRPGNNEFWRRSYAIAIYLNQFTEKYFKVHVSFELRWDYDFRNAFVGTRFNTLGSRSQELRVSFPCNFRIIYLTKQVWSWCACLFSLNLIVRDSASAMHENRIARKLT